MLIIMRALKIGKKEGGEIKQKPSAVDHDLELLSVYNSVKYFEHTSMLLDKYFIIFTDNKSLVHSFCKPSESHTPRQVRQLSLFVSI